MSSVKSNNDDGGAFSSEDDNYSNSDDESEMYEHESGSEYNYAEEDDNSEQCLQMSLFNQELVACPICCEDKVEVGCALVLPCCSHSFCITCFTTFVETEIGLGNADSISCPSILNDNASSKIQRCNVQVSMDVLHEIMPEYSYNRLQQQRDNAFVRKNADYHHCPTPDCTNIVLCPTIDGEEGETIRICDCFKCGNTSCLSCGATPFHTLRTCNEYREYQARKRASEAMEFARRRRIYAPVDRSRANEETRYDYMVERGDSNGTLPTNATFPPSNALLNNIKRCRRCGNGVELNDGCLKLKCICGYRFCYQCGSENAQVSKAEFLVLW